MSDTDLKKDDGMRVKEVAFCLDVSPRTVYSWCEKGLIDNYRINGSIRVPKIEVRILRPTS